MSEKKGNPKIFLFSLLLPFFWVSVGVIMDYLFPDKRLGVAGLVLIVYLSITPISLYMAKCYHRYFHTNEKIRLVVYFTVWALICDFWALWYYVSFESNGSFEGDALYVTLAITAGIDLLFMFLGVKFAGKKIFNYFYGKQEQEQEQVN